VVIVVFRSRLRPENADEFHALASEMLALAESMPGFLSYRSYRAEDGERCSVIEFESAEHLEAWRTHPRHRAAMQKGRERFYLEYASHVCEPLRESRFAR
jgi:heme-degrading monooxygenase HmoA